MHKTVLTLSLLALSLGAFAQAKPAPKEIACAVMTTHKVKIKDATKDKMYADYKGGRYYFCCAGCVPSFKKNPAKYEKSAHVKLPAKKKSA